MISREMSIKMLAETAGGHQAWVDFYLMATEGGALQYARKLNVSQALNPETVQRARIKNLGCSLCLLMDRSVICICSTCTTPPPSATSFWSSKWSLSLCTHF
jgi:hypothetical protein